MKSAPETLYISNFLMRPDTNFSFLCTKKDLTPFPFQLFVLFELAYPSEGMLWWKPVGLLAFGGLIEICQKMTGYRHFSVNDILADGVGILGYLGLYMAYQGSI